MQRLQMKIQRIDKGRLRHPFLVRFRVAEDGVGDK